MAARDATAPPMEWPVITNLYPILNESTFLSLNEGLPGYFLTCDSTAVQTMDATAFQLKGKCR